VDATSAVTAGLSHDRRGPRHAPSPSPRPLGRRSTMAVEVSVGYVRWVGVWARAWEGRAARGAEWDGGSGIWGLFRRRQLYYSAAKTWTPYPT
jgi:hypothetical protein